MIARNTLIFCVVLVCFLTIGQTIAAECNSALDKICAETFNCLAGQTAKCAVVAGITTCTCV